MKQDSFLWGWTYYKKLWHCTDGEKMYYAKIRSVSSAVINAYAEITFRFRTKTPTKDLRELVGGVSQEIEFTYDEMGERVKKLCDK